MALSPRRLLAAGALVTALGVAVAGISPVLGTASDGRTRPQQLLGGVALVVGWGVFALGIHKFGREGD